MKAQILILSLIVMSLTGCQTIGHTPEMKKELDANESSASKRFMKCGFDAISKFDDGVSPAYVIGRGIGQYCSDYAQAYANAAYEADGRSLDKEYFYELLVGKGFTNIVLLHRAEKLKGK